VNEEMIADIAAHQEDDGLESERKEYRGYSDSLSGLAGSGSYSMQS